MSHQVYAFGKEHSMAYVGTPPWHGLGQPMRPDVTISEMEIGAHLDWLVLESPVSFNIPGGFRDAVIPAEMKNRKVLYRSDSFEPLSIVGRDYKVVQPIEILEFYRDLMEIHNFTLEVAGSLDMGRKVWALAKMGDGYSLPGDDQIYPYLLLMTSYDTSLATTLMSTMVRAVCANTIDMAVMQDEKGEETSTVKVPHTDEFNAADVKLEAGLIDLEWYKYSKLCQDMARFTMPSTEAIEFFMGCVFETNQLKYTPWDELPAAQLKAYNSIMEGYLKGRGAAIKAAHGTLWGAVNAVTEYVDHHKPARSVNNRFKAAIMGKGRQLKLKAWKMAKKMVGADKKADLELSENINP